MIVEYKNHLIGSLSGIPNQYWVAILPDGTSVAFGNKSQCIKQLKLLFNSNPSGYLRVKKQASKTKKVRYAKLHEKPLIPQMIGTTSPSNIYEENTDEANQR